MAIFHQPLDLNWLLINSLSGSVALFFFVAFVFMAGLAAYFRMPNGVFVAMLVLFGLVMGYIVPSIMVFSLILVTLFFGWMLIRIFR